jgi:hypothetical protein
LVVGELAQEQVNNTKTVNDMVTAVNVLTGKIDELSEKVDKPKPVIVSADTRPAQEIMKKGVADMKIIVGTKPQPVVKKFQIQLFPERDAKLFYKIVFGRWFLFLVLMLLIQNLYNFSVHWSDNQKERKSSSARTRINFVENDRIKRLFTILAMVLPSICIIMSFFSIFCVYILGKQHLAYLRYRNIQIRLQNHIGIQNWLGPGDKRIYFFFSPSMPVF